LRSTQVLQPVCRPYMDFALTQLQAAESMSDPDGIAIAH